MKIGSAEVLRTVRPVTAGGKREKVTMKRTIATAVRTAATLALACSTALVFAVATVQARPTHTTRSQAATTAAVSTCKIVVT